MTVVTWECRSVDGAESRRVHVVRERTFCTDVSRMRQDHQDVTVSVKVCDADPTKDSATRLWHGQCVGGWHYPHSLLVE